MISQYFTAGALCLFCSPQGNDKYCLLVIDVIDTHEHAGEFKEP